MADQAIKYTVTADTSGFSAGMQAVARGLDSVRGLTGTTSTTFQQLAASMSQHMSEVGRTISAEVSGMAGHFGGLLEAVGASRAGMVALVGAAAAMAASKFVNATAEMTEQAMDLGRVLGESTNSAQAWRIALEDVNASQGDLEAAAKGMSKQLRENEDDLQAMGLKTRDASGQLRPMTELLLDGIEALNGYKEGADRALAAQTLFGRGMDASSKLLLVNREVLEEDRQTMAELGLEVGANAVAAWKEFDSATDRAGFGMKGLGNTIGAILMPVITDLVNIFNAAMPAAIVIVRGAVGGLATAWHGLATGVVVVGEVIKGVIYAVTEPIRSLGSAFMKLVTGDFKGATDEMMGLPDRIGAYWSQAMDNMTESAQRARDRIAAIWGGGDTLPGEPEGVRGTKGYVPPPAAPKKGTEKKEAEPSRMAEFEAALALEKESAAREDARREYGKEQEAAYWRNILNTTVLGKQDTLSVVSRFTKLETDVIREQAKQADQIDQEKLAAQVKRAEDTVALANAEGQRRVAAGEMTQEQLLEQESQLEERLIDIRREALLTKLGLVDPARDPVQYTQISLQIEEAERQHQLRMGQIITQQAKLTAQETGAIWTSLGNTMSGLWDKGIQAMMSGTLTWRGATKAIGAEMALWFAKDVVGSIVKQWLAGEAAKLAATVGFTSAERALRKIAGTETAAIKVKEATTVVGANATEAASGAAASQASIPWVGPVLAVAAFAAIMAMVMGAKSSIPSAAGGFDIPTGVNPLTQLHEREMVLPAKHADVIRSLADGGSGGGSVSVEVRGAPMPGGYFMMHRSEIVKAIKAAHRDLAF